MQALVEKAADYQVVLVASNKPQAPGLDWARAHGIPTWAWESRQVAREQFDETVSRALTDHHVGTIALAGYMRILSPQFVEAWRGRILNIHPSLLPKYKGLETHARALQAGDAVSGCTVHIVTEELDAGEVLGSTQVAIEPGDTPSSLESRVREAEHELYPRVLAEFVSRRFPQG